MENPIFRLAGVIKSHNEMEDFEGPLTLILQLISKNKIEIKDISISIILDQYLEYLDSMVAMDLEIASEFVSMASYLIYIKAKKLLSDNDDEITEMKQLVTTLEQLKCQDTYAQIKKVTVYFQEMFRKGAGYMTKPPECLPLDHEYKYCHDKQDIFDAILRLLGKKEASHLSSISKQIIFPVHDPYSVSEKMAHVIVVLEQNGVMYLKSFFNECEDRSEKVATLLAILEMCKFGSILLAGNDNNLTVRYTGKHMDEKKFEFEDK